MRYLISCFALIMVFGFCNLKKTGPKSTHQNPVPLTSDTLAAYESSLFSFRENPQVFILPANKISTVTGKKGLVLTIDPSKLETEDDSQVDKEISVYLTEMVNQDDLFRNDASTESDGKLLVSGGAYHIALHSGGKNLKIKRGQSLTTQFPKLTDSEMQIFYAQKDGDGNLNWKPSSQHLAEIIIKPGAGKIKKQTKSKQKVIQVSDSSSSLTQVEALMAYTDRKGRMATSELKDFLDSINPSIISAHTNATEVTEIKEIYDTITGARKKVKSKSYYRPVEITNLGWINVDRFYKNSNNINITCEFEFVNATDKVTLYVVFKNINSVLKEDLSLANKEDKSYVLNFLPVGEAVRIIAIARSKDEVFTAKSDLVIDKNPIVALKFMKAAEADLKKNVLH